MPLFEVLAVEGLDHLDALQPLLRGGHEIGLALAHHPGGVPDQPVDPEDEDGEKGETSAPIQRAGWFRFYFDQERWEWSDDVHRMHGYRPGSVG